MKKKFYISTAIAYTSGKPHIGNTYEIVLADAIARYKRLAGFDVYFQTGTDEHGQKIEQYALLEGKDPQAFVDEVSLEVRRIWDVMNTSYDKFVRTTNPSHVEKVTRIFKKLYEQGDIYKGNYEGLYCIPCESFYTDGQLIDGKCPDCGRDVVVTKEEAYFLKLSKYSKWLEEYIDGHPDFISPVARKNEIMNNFIKPGLHDLCVSRTSFKWGVPVDFDSGHIVYVWLDALSNYITFIGYDVDGVTDEFSNYWPADVHLIGKDILRFHTIYWPIILHALGLEQPKKIFGHPWILFGDDKMSKSKGNIIYADDLVNLFGVDAVRYYVLHEIPYSSDGIITYDLLIERFNADLANTLGNLVNRTISMVNKYFSLEVIAPTVFNDIDFEVIAVVKEARIKVASKIDDLKIADAIDDVFNIFRRCNKYIDETTPWILAADENKKDRLVTVMYTLLEAIRQGAVLLQAFLPATADEIFHQLNTENRFMDSLDDFNGLDIGIKLNAPAPLFERIKKDEKLT
ncbi:MAG: methionine--tRNA ligase, partial [Bacilli bacterium]